MAAPEVHWLGRTDYTTTWQAMMACTRDRTPDAPDALWVTEHDPVFTLGQAGLAEHVLDAGTIPVVPCDRGGQVTYHGPGQVVVYVLFDIARRQVGVRALVRLLEQAVVDLLAQYGITGEGRTEAPGVYVGDAKVASIGLRVRHGRTYHGIALNADMDLAPFQRINPCGYRGLAVTDLRSLGVQAPLATLTDQFARCVLARWAAAGPTRT